MRSVALVEAVRDAVGPEVEILVEMHGRFAPHEAIRVAGLLEPFEPAWIEEPVPPENLAALRKVAEHTPLPIATGERIHDRIEFRELFESRAVNIIQPDIGHMGGILETRKLAATAETHYVLIAPHNVGGPVLTAANLHLAACTPNFKIQEHFNDFADQEVLHAAPGLPPVDEDGYFALPDGARARRDAGRRLRRRAPEHRRALRPLPARLALPGDEVDGGADLLAGGARARRRAGGRARAGRGARAGRLRGHLRLRPRAAGGRAAGGVRPLPGRARPRVVGRRRGGRRGRGPAAGRPQGRRRGLSQLPGVRRVPDRARRRCARRPTRRPGFTQPGAWNDFLRLPARLLHVAARGRRPARRGAAGARRVRGRGVPAGGAGPRRAGRRGRRRDARAAVRAAAARLLAARAGRGRAARRARAAGAAHGRRPAGRCPRTSPPASTSSSRPRARRAPASSRSTSRAAAAASS